MFDPNDLETLKTMLKARLEVTAAQRQRLEAPMARLLRAYDAVNVAHTAVLGATGETAEALVEAGAAAERFWTYTVEQAAEQFMRLALANAWAAAPPSGGDPSPTLN